MRFHEHHGNKHIVITNYTVVHNKLTYIFHWMSLGMETHPFSNIEAVSNCDPVQPHFSNCLLKLQNTETFYYRLQCMKKWSLIMLKIQCLLFEMPFSHSEVGLSRMFVTANSQFYKHCKVHLQTWRTYRKDSGNAVKNYMSQISSVEINPINMYTHMHKKQYLHKTYVLRCCASDCLSNDKIGYAVPLFYDHHLSYVLHCTLVDTCFN